MGKNEARMIKYLWCEGRVLHTYRRLAEIYYAPDDPGYGNQMYGEDLVKEAATTLEEDYSQWCEILEGSLANLRATREIK